MKPERNVLEVDSTVEGTDVIMGVAPGAMSKIATILTDMYADPEQAPIRELSCNAYDSHVAAGQSRPIEVEVGRQGSQLSLPVLRIQDWGLGLTEDEVKEIYSQYGASTKDHSDDFVGMLGIGSKSPLAYTDQFVVTARKDGHQIVVVASRNDDGALIMTILDGGATVEPNGVLVEVPVKPQNDLLSKAEQFFRFWERGTVLVNGKEPTPIWEAEGAYQMSDRIWVVPESEANVKKDVVVMGGVPYPTDFELYDRSYSGDGKVMICRVDIGAVSFTPSREELMDTQRTKTTLAALRKEFNDAAAKTVADAVAAANTHGDALNAFMTAREALPRSARPDPQQFAYKGETLPDFPEVFGATTLRSAGYKYATGKKKPGLGDVADAIWVTEFDNSNFTGSQREKLKLYIKEERASDFPPTNSGYGMVVDDNRPLFLLPDKTVPHDKWVPSNHRIAWPDVRKWTPPGGVAVAGHGTKVISGSYWAHLRQDQNNPSDAVKEVAADQLPSSSLYWVHAGKYAGKGDARSRWEPGGPNWLSLARVLDPNAVLVLLSSNRIEKFKRDFPHAKEMHEAIKNAVAAEARKLSKDKALALTLPDTYDDFATLDKRRNELDDPDLQRLVQLSALRVRESNALDDLSNRARKWDAKLPEANADEAKKLRETIKVYPLIPATGYDTRPIDHLIIYANAAYAVQQKEAN